MGIQYTSPTAADVAAKNEPVRREPVSRKHVAVHEDTRAYANVYTHSVPLVSSPFANIRA